MIIPFEDPQVQCISGGGFRLFEVCGGQRSFIIFPAAIKAVDRRANQIIIYFDKDIVIQITGSRLDIVYAQISACLGV